MRDYEIARLKRLKANVAAEARGTRVFGGRVWRAALGSQLGLLGWPSYAALLRAIDRRIEDLQRRVANGDSVSV